MVLVVERCSVSPKVLVRVDTAREFTVRLKHTVVDGQGKTGGLAESGVQTNFECEHPCLYGGITVHTYAYIERIT